MKREFQIPIFDVSALVIIAKDPVAARNDPEVVSVFGPNVDGDDWEGLYVTPVKGKFCVIFSQDRFCRGLFAHEMYHLTEGILDWCDVKGEEAAALLNGYLHETIHPMLYELGI